MRREILAGVAIGAVLAAAWYADRELDIPIGLSELGAELEDLVGMGPAAEDLLQVSREANVQAFLATIRHAEGTARAGVDGYRMLFGGELVATLADHPRQRITRPLGGRFITSTAAGAYQFLEGTWDEVAGKLGLPDFSPVYQDVAAVARIRYRGALEDVRAGRFDEAVRKCAKEWASLPGSPYGQPTKTFDQVRQVYAAAGGGFA